MDKKFAETSWCAEDIQKHRRIYNLPEWTVEQCEEWLKEKEDILEDSMVTAGWDTIKEYMEE